VGGVLPVGTDSVWCLFPPKHAGSGVWMAILSDAFAACKVSCNASEWIPKVRQAMCYMRLCNVYDPLPHGHDGAYTQRCLWLNWPEATEEEHGLFQVERVPADLVAQYAGGDVNPHTLTPELVMPANSVRDLPAWVACNLHHAPESVRSRLPVLPDHVCLCLSVREGRTRPLHAAGCWHSSPTHLLPLCSDSQVLDALPHKAYVRGKERALQREKALPLALGVDAAAHKCVIRVAVPPSYSTKGDYIVHVHLDLSRDCKTITGNLDAFCVCQNGARKKCTHVAAALFTLREYAYAAGLVPGKVSKIVSCTDRAKSWGAPKGNACKEDLARDAEYFFPLKSVKMTAEKERKSKKRPGVALEGQASKKPRKSTSIKTMQEEVIGWGIGKDMSEEQLALVKAALKALEAANDRAQAKKRAKKSARAEKRKAAQDQAQSGGE
jgi:hypothetical protein